MRINASGVAALKPMSDRACVKGQLCVLKQCAAYTVVETLKGERLSVLHLTSGYGGGDCGIPLIAGAYYVRVPEPAERVDRLLQCGGAVSAELALQGSPSTQHRAFPGVATACVQGP